MKPIKNTKQNTRHQGGIYYEKPEHKRTGKPEAGSGKPCTHRYYEPPQGAERSEQSDLG